MTFEGKVALVTGAASGMGRLLCEKLAALDCKVVAVDLKGESLKELCRCAPAQMTSAECDVRDYTAVKAAVEQAISVFGRLDILVNLAGGAEKRMLSQKGEFPDIPIEVYDWSIDVNLKGQLYFAHAAMKYMREQKSGVIVNIGSVTGKEGCAGNIGYAASKSGAMNGLTKSLALYGSKYGVRCVCVSPGPVMTRPGMAGMKTAVGRAAEPQELCDLILYVASEKGAFLNGIDILADGGRNILHNKEW